MIISIATLSLALIGVSAVLYLVWQHRRSARTIIRKLDANETLDAMSSFFEPPAPELRLVGPDETAPPPPPADSGRGAVGRFTAVSTGTVLVALLSVAILNGLPKRGDPPSGVATSPANQASASLTASISLATASHPQAQPARPSNTSSAPAAAWTAPHHLLAAVPTAAHPEPVPSPAAPHPVATPAPAVNASAPVPTPPASTPTAQQTPVDPPKHRDGGGGGGQAGAASLLSNVLATVTTTLGLTLGS